MAKLRTAMDAAFWDFDMASPHNLDGCAKAVPGESFPLDCARAGRALRVQQLSLLGNGFPLGIIPSLSPNPNPNPANKDLGSFALHSLLLRPSFRDWWLGVVGQFRPKKLISNIKAEVLASDEWELPSFKDVARHFLDKSLYSIGSCTQIPISSSSSLLLSTEAHGERRGRRDKLMLYHKLPYHDITLEAAWPELFIDSKGRYWNVPESVSLDLLSSISESGLRYRFGLHKNGGQPQAVNNSIYSEAPAALLPGVCAKAAFSYEKSKDFWRQKETEDDLIVKTDKGKFWRPAYDVRLKEPHASISAIIGGSCGAWFQGEDNALKGTSRKRSPVFADLFGSVCYTFQHGKFRKLYGDLTRVDARLDICSASGFAKNMLRSVWSDASNPGQQNPASLPRLSLIFQQQVAGPIVVRIDSKFAPGKKVVEMEDFMCSLSYSLRLLESGKVVAWYSPKRKEGMIELRLFEF